MTPQAKDEEILRLLVQFDITMHYVDQAILEERERCAQIAETWEQWCGRKGYNAEEYACEDIAAKIRRGEI